MLHKIPTDQLEIGMFVHSMEGSWFSHPFWRSRFMLTKTWQLEKMIASETTMVTIDDSLGKGPSLPEPPIEPLPGDAPAEAAEDAGAHPAMMRRSRSMSQDIELPLFTRLSPRERAAEVRKASGAIKRSRAAVMNLFADARMGNAIKSEKMAPLVEQISRSVTIDPTIILNIARLKTKDEYTYLHSVAVCALMVNLARKMGMAESMMQEVGMAGLLHDVGKTSIPDDILSKPGKLDDMEWITVRNHPQRGYDILSASEGVGNIALEVCLRHHEKMDGSGYPGGIPADSLSVYTRMAAICDVYDAITSQRSYNTPMSASQALAKMQSWSGHFDKLIFRDFVDSLGILPVGTLLRLDRNELGVVIGESPSNYAAPIVRCFFTLTGNREIELRDMDMGRSKSRKILAIEDPEDWGWSDWPDYSRQLLAKDTN